jgi:hypothetical protein
MTGLEGLGDLVPVLAGRVAERGPDQVDDAGLGDGLRPDRADGVGQALESVAHDHADVCDAAVLDLGQDVQPVLGSLTAVAGPQSEDLPGALDRDRERHVDGLVGDLAVAELHMHAVDEDHRSGSAAHDREPAQDCPRHMCMRKLWLLVVVLTLAVLASCLVLVHMSGAGNAKCDAVMLEPDGTEKRLCP